MGFVEIKKTQQPDVDGQSWAWHPVYKLTYRGIPEFQNLKLHDLDKLLTFFQVVLPLLIPNMGLTTLILWTNKEISPPLAIITVLKTKYMMEIIRLQF